MRRIAASSAGLIRVLPLFVVNGQIIATRRGSVLRYTHADHLGSASLQTDTNGNSVASTNVGHWSYGTVRTGSPTALNTDRTYTGQKQDSTG
ncbi:hypothetical protein GC175_14915, partial [bacterium]|nr:hypothetical protein [bacterium]